MKKSVFVVANVDKGGIQSRHEFSHSCQIKIANGVAGVTALFLQRDKAGIFKQCYGDFFFAYIYYQFAFHWWLKLF